MQNEGRKDWPQTTSIPTSWSPEKKVHLQTDGFSIRVAAESRFSDSSNTADGTGRRFGLGFWPCHQPDMQVGGTLVAFPSSVEGDGNI